MQIQNSNFYNQKANSKIKKPTQQNAVTRNGIYTQPLVSNGNMTERKGNNVSFGGGGFGGCGMGIALIIIFILHKIKWR